MRYNLIKYIIFCSFLLSPLKSTASPIFAIKNDAEEKAKILFLGFNSEDQNLKDDTKKIITKIKQNLDTTNLFEVKASDEKISIDAIDLIDFEKYRSLKINAIVSADFGYIGENLEIRVRMIDVLDQKQMFGKFYSSPKGNYKKASNLLSDEIFKALTGEKIGHFDSKILYVSESGSIKKRIKKISIIDFDGENKQVLTDGRDLVLTPVFSKKPDEIFYLRYFKNKPQIFSFDLRTLKSKRVGGFKGTTFAASVHPLDQNIMLLSAIIDGNTDVFELNLRENIARRLTKSPSIDTTASYSPDGKKIVFTSDRDSGQQIYEMSENGSSVRKISVGGGSYSKPMYSPDGKMIAFTRIKSGQFYIGVMSPSGKNEKLLSSGYVVEGAKWSPNSRYLVYSKKESSYGLKSIPRLFVVDAATGFEFEVPTPQFEGATDPDWIKF
jgi:TolB protein